MTGKVLVVDDLPQNVKMLEAKLSGEYYTVYTAESGRGAIQKAKELAPDIILLDVMMPEMDGFEACKILKSDPETAQIPVVMVTALSEVEDRVQGLEAGANDFITKPIDEVHLFARVKSLIRLKVLLDELQMRDKTGSQFGLEDYAALYKEIPQGTILVIDDDIVQSRKIQQILSSKGHTVEVVDPEDAMDAVTHKEFDLVIINTMLDDADGLRFGVQIRSQEQTRRVPIMILVDEDDKPLLVKGLEIGIDDYLMTPMDDNELLARATTQLRRKKYQDALRSHFEESLSAAVVDSLTKLYNRRYLDAHLENMVEEALKNNTPLSLMSIDIDHFKSVNDRPGWGHAIGDEVLKEVAERIMNSIRTTDLATRPGGEEFVVVMPNTDTQAAMAVAERTRKSMDERPFTISAEPGELKSSISVGVATLKHSGDSAEEMLKRSDDALYKAKDGGRNQVVMSE